MRLNWCEYHRKYVPTTSCRTQLGTKGQCEYSVGRGFSSLRELRTFLEGVLCEGDVNDLVRRNICGCPKYKYPMEHIEDLKASQEDSEEREERENGFLSNSTEIERNIVSPNNR